MNLTNEQKEKLNNIQYLQDLVLKQKEEENERKKEILNYKKNAENNKIKENVKTENFFKREITEKEKVSNDMKKWMKKQKKLNSNDNKNNNNNNKGILFNNKINYNNKIENKFDNVISIENMSKGKILLLIL